MHVKLKFLLSALLLSSLWLIACSPLAPPPALPVSLITETNERIDPAYFSLLDSLRTSEQAQNDSLARIPCQPLDMSYRAFFKLIAKDSLVKSAVLELPEAQKNKAWANANKEFWVTDSWGKPEYKNSEKICLELTINKYSCEFSISKPQEYSINLSIAKIKSGVFLVSTGFWDSEDYTTEAEFYFLCWDKLSKKLIRYPRPPRFYVRDVQTTKQFNENSNDTLPNGIWNAEIRTGYQISKITRDSITLEMYYGEVYKNLYADLCGKKELYSDSNRLALDYWYILKKNFNINNFITLKY